MSVKQPPLPSTLSHIEQRPPAPPDDLIRAVTNSRAGLNNAVLQGLARWGVWVYSLGKYQSTSSCDLARSLRETRVLLLTGGEGDPWRLSTLELGKCFTSTVEVKKDLPLTGFNLPASTGQEEEAYDRPVIEFFDKALR